MKPILSVAVASYNVENYLDKCLSSFAEEDFSGRLQVIIVNDGSTDNTQKIAEEYVTKYPGIFFLINKKNGGHGSAVNAGIDAAEGKYFRIVDGDDWVNTENMRTLLSELENSEADIVADKKREVDMTTGQSVLFELPKSVAPFKTYNFDEICNSYELSSYVMIHTISVKTEILKEHKIHLLEGVFYVDIEFIIKSSAYAHTIEFLDLEIYQYLVGNAQQSVNYKNYVRRYSHHDKVVKEVLQFCNYCGGMPDKKREYLTNRACLLINTHMNISLIYNEDRKCGRIQAAEFRCFLKASYPELYNRTAKRYLLTLFLHYMGVNYERLQFIKSLRK